MTSKIDSNEIISNHFSTIDFFTLDPYFETAAEVVEHKTIFDWEKYGNKSCKFSDPPGPMYSVVACVVLAF